jgi:hypothetical protein
MFGCLWQARRQARLARGWRDPPSPISNRRKVASGCSAFLASSSLPLTLQAIAKDSWQTMGLAVLVLFVGLHFFGWARRDLVVGRLPLGEIIYQTSMLPTDFIRFVLRTVGDACHQLIHLAGQILIVSGNTVVAAGRLLCNGGEQVACCIVLVWEWIVHALVWPCLVVVGEAFALARCFISWSFSAFADLVQPVWNLLARLLRRAGCLGYAMAVSLGRQALDALVYMENLLHGVMCFGGNQIKRVMKVFQWIIGGLHQFLSHFGSLCYCIVFPWKRRAHAVLQRTLGFMGDKIMMVAGAIQQGFLWIMGSVCRLLSHIGRLLYTAVLSSARRAYAVLQRLLGFMGGQIMMAAGAFQQGFLWIMGNARPLVLCIGRLLFSAALSWASRAYAVLQRLLGFMGGQILMVGQAFQRLFRSAVKGFQRIMGSLCQSAFSLGCFVRNAVLSWARRTYGQIMLVAQGFWRSFQLQSSRILKLAHWVECTYESLANKVKCLGRAVWCRLVPKENGPLRRICRLIYRQMWCLVDNTELFIHRVLMHCVEPSLVAMQTAMEETFDWIDRLLHVTCLFLSSCVTVLSAAVYRASAWALDNIVQPNIKRVARILESLYGHLVIVLSPFFKKYWRLISAGLAINGSFLFSMAAMTESSFLGRVKFCLGAWSLALIGFCVGQSVVAASGTLASKLVVIDESPISYVDLYIGYGTTRVFSSGWHAMSMLLDLTLKVSDLGIRRTCACAWWLLESSFGLIILPSSRFWGKVFKKIWDSPFSTLSASIGAAGMAYLLHSNQISAPALSLSSEGSIFAYWKNVSAGLAHALSWSMEHLSLAASSIHSVMSLLWIDVVLEPIANADTSSSNVALLCWLVTTIVTKTRKRVRVKTFAVPILIFYATGVAASSLAKAVYASVLVWFVLSLVVDKYEIQSQSLAKTAFRDFKNRHWRTAKAPPLPSSSTEDECAICLEGLGHTAAPSTTTTGKDSPTEVVSLPCGHCFHHGCIGEWFHSSSVQRCPLCRHAVGGWDRALEVVF